VGEHGQYRLLVTGARRAAFVLALLAAAPAQAQGCRLALALALDVSSSVDSAEYALQRQGLAAALLAPEVRDAFLSVPGLYVALQVYEWSGRNQQVIRQDWVAIGDEADLDAVAGRLAGMARSYAQYPTALGFAMGFGARRLAERPDCRQHTLDISGDGTNNDGFPPDIARREFPFEDVIVNGLVIGANRETLRRYFEQFVIHGPGAFVETATDYADFERAMRRKLQRELGVGQVSQLGAGVDLTPD
jgi:Protein of unknown function (DUF1194)